MGGALARSLVPLALASVVSLAATGTAGAARPLPSPSEYGGQRATGLAWRALAEGRLADAAEQAAVATALLPEGTSGWAVAARAAIGAGRWDDAATAVTQLRRLAPDDLEGLELLGRISVELGRAAEAREALRALGALEPRSVAPTLGLALVAARLDGDVAAATALLRAAGTDDPRLDLSGLLLRPEWAPLANDPAFVDALNSLLRQASRP